jgi:arabinofuranosyltransferase
VTQTLSKALPAATRVRETPVEDEEAGSPAGEEGKSTRPTRLVSWLVLAVPVVIVLIGAWSYRWVCEDAFIDFRVIGNLLAGNGPVFNVGERVEVYSDPLWVALLTITHEMVPFVSLEWLSVVLGLAGTATGVVLGGRAMQRLGSSDHDGVIIPIGMLLFSVVAGVWEFATSGLEMGMAFGWIGLSFWLLVRIETRRKSAASCAIVMGLGPLIRPEFLLISVVFLVGLACVVASPGWQGATTVRRRWVFPYLAAIALPVIYELWRMAYFAMFVSNSELAKSGGGSDLPQGLTYFWNFTSTYVLWVPFILALLVVVPTTRRWWSSGAHSRTVVLMTPVVAGLCDALYVVHVGGDYMEARLLLPAYLCGCLAVFVDTTQLRTMMVIPVLGLVGWSVMCLGALRPSAETSWVNNMHDERANWIYDTGQRHPIDVSGYGRLLALGAGLRTVTDSTPPGHQSMVVLSNPGEAFIDNRGVGPDPVVLAKQIQSFIASNRTPAQSDLKFRVAVDIENIGALGYVAGPDVYVYDALSLANPIGSHTTVAVRGIPGHEKLVGPAWMLARFGMPGDTYAKLPIFGVGPETAAAKRAIHCNPLNAYLGAITKPLTLSQALSNVVHSFTYTRMTFSPDPIDAASQLCGS